MTLASNDGTTLQKQLRVWPGVLAVSLQWLAWFVVPFVFPEAGPYGIAVGLFAGLAVVVWWLFFSRAPWSERVGAIVLMVVLIVTTKRVVHESIAGGGMGWLLYIYAIPVLSLALVAATVASRHLASSPRRATMIGAFLLACGIFTLVRTGGITGEGGSDLHWRWTDTPEERLLAEAIKEPPALSTPAGAEARADWLGFRGPNRDGVVRGVRIETDWSKSPPVEMWRWPIGPGWSSFAVQGDLFYTQEQRGDEELVSCHQVITGAPVWTHRDATRFWESNAGAGPRSTPTLGDNRVYTFGATGILNALNALDGAVAWSRHAATDASKQTPHWGFTSSPLAIDDLIIVAVSDRLVAYDVSNGQLRWIGPTGGGGSYSSPHFMTIQGVPQILLLAGGGVVSVSPNDGTLLWKHSWEPGASIIQPALTPDGDVLIAAADEMGGIGMRSIRGMPGPTGWTLAERWTSRGLKPYFNDCVVHKRHAFGFDNSILACIDLEGGTRKWKGGRYGHGQLILLSDQDLLLVLSERGELALVAAAPDQFTELARFPAIEGKTWNHPVLAGDILLVRNDQEMAAYRLSLAER